MIRIDNIIIEMILDPLMEKLFSRIILFKFKLDCLNIWKINDEIIAIKGLNINSVLLEALGGKKKITIKKKVVIKIIVISELISFFL